MTTTLQLALLAGALVGLGVALLLTRLVPVQPDLADALDRLSPERSLPLPTKDLEPRTSRDRLGLWLMRRLPLSAIGSPPDRELAMVRLPLHRFYAEKALYALVGLAFPSAAAAILAILGVRVPVVIPLIGSIALAVAMSFIPDANVRTDAAKARIEFRRALAPYIDLVALERNAGLGARQSLEQAAQVGDSWVFQRIAEELARSRWSGVSAWDSLASLSVEVDVSDLADLADIMRLSGEEGASVYQTLRARSAGLRAAMLTDELGRAKVTNERMSAPGAVLFIITAATLAAPSVLRFLA